MDMPLGAGTVLSHKHLGERELTVAWRDLATNTSGAFPNMWTGEPVRIPRERRRKAGASPFSSLCSLTDVEDRCRRGEEPDLQGVAIERHRDSEEDTPAEPLVSFLFPSQMQLGFKAQHS